MSRMHLDLADLKSRINLHYADTPGTESFERRLCVEEIERLTAECAELLATLVALTNEPQPLGIYRPAYQAAIATVWKHYDEADTPEAWAARRAVL